MSFAGEMMRHSSKRLHSTFSQSASISSSCPVSMSVPRNTAISHSTLIAVTPFRVTKKKDGKRTINECFQRKTRKDCVKASLYKWTLRRDLEALSPLLGPNQVALSTKDHHFKSSTSP